jgi:serine protease Do
MHKLPTIPERRSRPAMRSFKVLCAILAVSLPLSVASARPAPDSFADLADKLLPTVVNIATSQTLKPRARQNLPQLPPGSPLEDLFKNFLGPRDGQPRHVTSLGSGFIIDPSCPPPASATATRRASATG